MKKKDLLKKILWNPWTAVLTLLVMVAIRYCDGSFVESVRLRYFDQLVTSQPSQAIPVNVVNIDEATLDKYGQYPFPRDYYANIIKDVYAHGAGLVVFNVLMPETDRFKQDSVLANTMTQFPTVLPIVATPGGNKNIDQKSKVQAPSNVDPHGLVVEYPSLISNVSPQGEAAAGLGLVNTFPEVDGVVRRLPLIVMANDQLQPSLALETLRVAAGDSRIQTKFNDVGVEAVRIPSFMGEDGTPVRINTDSLSRVWIDWSQTPKEYSLVDLPKSFNNEIVIVGTTIAGFSNPVATSKGEVYPHYLQASALGTMLSGTSIQRPEWADRAEIWALIILSLIIILLSRWTYVGLAATVAVIFSITPATFYLYNHYKFLFDATAVTAGFVFVALHCYGVKFVSEFLQKQAIRKQFSSYLSPDLVAKLVKNPGLLQLGGAEQELSISFTDVRGFTAISEHYGKDVQGLTKIMNRYMTAMCKPILTNGGTLDKFIGDAIMYFFNAPLDNTKHCKDSVKTALEMKGRLDEFNKEIASEGVPPFGMGIGINTGVVVVGNMGSEQRFSYTCLGDAVNLASRLEGQSKNYGVLIVLGPVTAERLGDEYFTVELDCIAVKGKKEGVTIYTVFYNPAPEAADKWNAARNKHNEMLAAYRQQDWRRAVKLVNELQGEFNGQMDHYYEIWLERIEDMRNAKLPETWDGIYRATSK